MRRTTIAVSPVSSASIRRAASAWRMSRSLLTFAPVRSAASVRSGRARRCDRRSRSRPASGDSGRPSRAACRASCRARPRGPRRGPRRSAGAGGRGRTRCPRQLPRVAGRARWSCVVLGRFSLRGNPSRARDGSTASLRHPSWGGWTDVRDLCQLADSDEEIARRLPIPLVKQPNTKDISHGHHPDPSPADSAFAPAITLGLAAVVLTSFAVVALGGAAARRFRRRPGSSRHRAPRRQPIRRWPNTQPPCRRRRRRRTRPQPPPTVQHLGRRQRRDADPGRPRPPRPAPTSTSTSSIAPACWSGPHPGRPATAPRSRPTPSTSRTSIRPRSG